MAYDNTGAAVGAAGHYAAALTSALITAGRIGVGDVLVTFTNLLADTFAACEALKGEQPEAPAAPARARSYGGNRGSGGRSSGSGNSDPGTLDFRTGKHAGETISAVYDTDPDYLDWCVENLKNDFMVGKISSFLATAA